MPWRISQTGIAPRPACWLGLPFALLVLAAGCSSRVPHSTEHVEVSGKVLFQGQPLPGGRITFIALHGGFADTGNIDENGNYHVNAPVGPVQISVNNRNLAPGAKKPEKFLKNLKLDPKSTEPRIPGGNAKGRYVPIPPKYYQPETSQLTYEVKPEPQTHDIILDNDGPGMTANQNAD